MLESLFLPLDLRQSSFHGFLKSELVAVLRRRHTLLFVSVVGKNVVNESDDGL